MKKRNKIEIQFGIDSERNCIIALLPTVIWQPYSSDNRHDWVINFWWIVFHIAIFGTMKAGGAKQ